jgi:hypothetical protein
MNKFKNYNDYLTLFNGGSTFLVKISKKDAYVYKNKDDQRFHYISNLKKLSEILKKKFNNHFNKLVKHFKFTRKILGKDPYSKKKYMGNSILFCTGKNEYIFVGQFFITFTSLSNIKIFVSPIGNSSVAYPYAIDNDKNYYLFTENVIINNVPKKYNEQPYLYYYKDTGKFLKKIN